MIENIYYIIPTNSTKLTEWLNSSLVVESDINNLRVNVPEILTVIKTLKGDTKPLSGAGVGFTYAKILLEMQKPNWRHKEDI